MRLQLSMLTLILTLLVGSSFTSLESPIGNWEKLGSKKVSFKLDRDVLHVGAREGGYTKLKVVVTGGNVNMHKMVVEYANGTKDNIALKHNFSRGSDTRVIDLQGGKRLIKDITFWYDTKNASNKRAKVHVYGKK